MLRVDRAAAKLVKLEQTTLSDAGLDERSGLQELILKNALAFFEQECSETLFVIKEEVEPSTQVGDRIDLLAFDTEGRAVIVELKRRSHKLHLLQSLTYAAMISDWSSDDFEKQLPPSRIEEFKDFKSEHGFDDVNEFQRVILIAESFGFETLRTAQWLTESYGLNITCYKISLAQEANGGAEYLSAVQLFPPRELAVQARRRGSLKSEKGNKFADIEELLGSCTNEAVIKYFQLSTALRRNRRRDSIVYPKLGKMRFRVRPEGDYARASQLGRFDGDQIFWEKGLSEPHIKLRPSDVRFRLKTQSDFDYFRNFAETEIHKVAWSKVTSSEEEDAPDED